MDAGIAVKPIIGVAPTDYARPAASVDQGAVPTDLPEAKAVNPLPAAEPTRHDAQPPGNSNAVYDVHGYAVDPQTREVVYRVMDSRTRQVLWQTPDAALLRRNAYARTISDGEKKTPAKNQTDIKG